MDCISLDSYRKRIQNDTGCPSFIDMLGGQYMCTKCKHMSTINELLGTTDTLFVSVTDQSLVCNYCTHTRLCDISIISGCAQCYKYTVQYILSILKHLTWSIRNDDSPLRYSIVDKQNYHYYACVKCNHDVKLTPYSVRSYSCVYCYKNKLCLDQNCFGCTGKMVYKILERCNILQNIVNEDEKKLLKTLTIEDTSVKFTIKCTTCVSHLLQLTAKDIFCKLHHSGCIRCAYCLYLTVCDNIECVYCDSRRMVNHRIFQLWHPSNLIDPFLLNINNFSPITIYCMSRKHKHTLSACLAIKKPICISCIGGTNKQGSDKNDPTRNYFV